jgi:hypothetical protein
MLSYNGIFILLGGIVCAGLACQKSTTAPSESGVAAFTVVNAIPYSEPVVPVINTSSTIMYFHSAKSISYGHFYEYSPIGGDDTVYVVQRNSDTLNLGPKASGLMFYNITEMNKGGIYSLFLCGADTTSPDYLLTTDTLPYYNPADSVLGIRFINLSAGSNPISINLEGNPDGSEVDNLSYKNITGFKNYVTNSTINNYLFVVRDEVSGDSLTQFVLGGNNGYGLTDPNNGNLLLCKNVTVAVYGSESSTNRRFPLRTMLIDNY